MRTSVGAAPFTAAARPGPTSAATPVSICSHAGEEARNTLPVRVPRKAHQI